VFSFFLENLGITAERLRNVLRVNSAPGQVSDDAATGQGLLSYFRRAAHCGAISEQEAELSTGLTPAELGEGSFAQILETRRR
jgi:hypothetical protein